jgi:hypothetical protein
MEVWLSKPAKAFIELEAYFENPSQPEPDEIDEEVFDENWYDAHLPDDP